MARTRAQENRAIRQEALREQLAQQKHHEHVIDLVNKLTELGEELDAVQVNRLKIAIDTKLKLTGKYLPELKAVEVSTGEGGLEMVTRVEKHIVSPKEGDS